jgi:hypothetical protein
VNAYSNITTEELKNRLRILEAARLTSSEPSAVRAFMISEIKAELRRRQRSDILWLGLGFLALVVCILIVTLRG